MVPTVLKNLRIRTIGSVDRPANQMARVELIKRDDSEEISKALTTEEKSAFERELKDDPTQDIVSAHRRIHQWATTGALPTGMNKADLVWVHNAIVAELERRAKEENPDEPYKHDSPLSVSDIPDRGGVGKCASLQNLTRKVKERAEKSVGKSSGELTFKDKLKRLTKGLFGGNNDAEEAKDLVTVLDSRQRQEVLWNLTSALQESLDSILEDEKVTDKQAAIGQVLQQFLAALVDSGVTKAGRKISAERLALLKQMKDMLEQLITEAEAGPEQSGNNVENYFMSKRKEEGKLAEVIKFEQLPEEVRKQLEEVEELKKKAAEAEELRKRVEEAEALAKAEREERIKREYISKAASFQALPIKPEEFGLVMKALAEKDPENYAKVEAVLKAADEAIVKAGLFAEIGRSGNTAGSAVQKAEALACEMIQKNAGMTKEQALAKVWVENPELYAEYEKEMKGGVR